jgi:hypothetical protein
MWRRPENLMLASCFIAVSLLMHQNEMQEPGPSKLVDILARLSAAFAVSLWVLKDSARHGRHRPLIFGFMLLLAWPVLAPWHLIQTRRWRALITLALFAAILLAAAFLPVLL